MKANSYNSGPKTVGYQRGLQSLRLKESPKFPATSVRAFTLVELLVVISIIALLVSILMPALGRARDQAKGVVCMSNLKQWGLCYAMYTNENEGKFIPGWDPQVFSGDQLVESMWMEAMRPYYQDDGIRFCPSATKLAGVGGPKTAWGELIGGGYYSNDGVSGSYGINGWVRNPTGVGGFRQEYPVDGHWKSTSRARRAYNVPVFMDCIWWEVSPGIDNLPGVLPPVPVVDHWTGHMGDPYRMFWAILLDRHNEGINIGFMDWSVRNVPIKRLWELEWWKGYDTQVRPTEAWPAWMEDFRE